MSLYLRGRVWWSRIEVAGKLYQFTTRATSKHLARSIETARRVEIIKGTAGLSAPDLTSFAGPFVNSLFGGRVSRETRRFYLCHLQALLNFDALANARLDRIDAALIEQFVQHRRKSVSATTINHALRTLRRMLHLAAEWGEIARVPKVRLLRGEVQREYVITEDTISRFAALPDLIGRVVIFLVDTGLRRAELCGLLWAHVNMRERVIFVEKGKTKFARRRIPMTKRVEAVLTALPHDGEHVFSFRHRGVTRDWLSHSFLRVRRKLNLPKDCVLHSTRHTFCTRLGERGADAFAIQRLAGHSSIVISQRYVHPAAARLDAAIALLE
jgi:integrase